MKPTILLATTSSWYPTARLAMALAAAGCEVDAVCPAGHPLRRTKAFRRAYIYRGLAPLLSFDQAIAQAEPDLVVSGDDLATRHLHSMHARQRREGKSDSTLSALIERSLGAPDSFPLVDARADFINLAQQEGLRVPPTQVIRNSGQLRQYIESMGLPVALKANGTSGGNGVRIAHTVAEAEFAFEQLQAPPLLARAAKRALVNHDKTLVWPSLLRQRRVVNAQGFVSGREATSTVVCWKGEILASLHFEVVNKTSSAGHATVVRLIEHPEMAGAAEAIVRRLQLSGMYGFDFMIETGTESAYLIEINPRATQVGHLTLGPGRDLPAALYAALSGKALRTAPKVTEKETIALFPQEWIRDPQSAYLQSAYHDVPWNEPGLIRDCVSNSRRQRAWYARSPRKSAVSPVRSSQPVSTATTRPAVSVELRHR